MFAIHLKEEFFLHGMGNKAPFLFCHAAYQGTNLSPHCARDTGFFVKKHSVIKLISGTVSLQNFVILSVKCSKAVPESFMALQYYNTWIHFQKKCFQYMRVLWTILAQINNYKVLFREKLLEYQRFVLKPRIYIKQEQISIFVVPLVEVLTTGILVFCATSHPSLNMHQTNEGWFGTWPMMLMNQEEQHLQPWAPSSQPIAALWCFHKLNLHGLNLFQFRIKNKCQTPLILTEIPFSRQAPLTFLKAFPMAQRTHIVLDKIQTQSHEIQLSSKINQYKWALCLNCG